MCIMILIIHTFTKHNNVYIINLILMIKIIDENLKICYLIFDIEYKKKVITDLWTCSK